MLQDIQYIMVRPDGSEIVIVEFIEDTNDPVSWYPSGYFVMYPYGRRIKGPNGDLAWLDEKNRILAIAEAGV